jgi:hypothetical protein
MEIPRNVDVITAYSRGCDLRRTYSSLQRTAATLFFQFSMRVTQMCTSLAHYYGPKMFYSFDVAMSTHKVCF